MAGVFHDAVSWEYKLAAIARPDLVRCGVLTRLWPSQNRAICRVCASAYADLPTTPRSDPAPAAEPFSGDARTRHHTADPAPAVADVEETR